MLTGGGDVNKLDTHLKKYVDDTDTKTKSLYDTQTKQYSENPDMEILSNTNEVHAVRENKLGITGINFWKDSDIDTNFDGVTVNKKASIMIYEKENGFEVSISDPTQKASKIKVEMMRSAKDIISKDEAITILETSPRLKFEVNVDKAKHKVNPFMLNLQMEMKLQKLNLQN